MSIQGNCSKKYKSDIVGQISLSKQSKPRSDCKEFWFWLRNKKIKFLFCSAMAQYYIFSCFITILIAYKLYTSAHCCWIKEVFFIYQLYINKYEPRHKISNNVVCAASKASDQPGHMPCLIRAFASRLNIL